MFLVGEVVHVRDQGVYNTPSYFPLNFGLNLKLLKKNIGYEFKERIYAHAHIHALAHTHITINPAHLLTTQITK